jgi:hypothetical protein
MTPLQQFNFPLNHLKTQHQILIRQFGQIPSQTQQRYNHNQHTKQPNKMPRHNQKVSISENCLNSIKLMMREINESLLIVFAEEEIADLVEMGEFEALEEEE